MVAYRVISRAEAHCNENANESEATNPEEGADYESALHPPTNSSHGTASQPEGPGDTPGVRTNRENNYTRTAGLISDR